MAKIHISGGDHVNGDGSIRNVTHNGSTVETIVVDGVTVWNKPVDGVFSGWSGWSACTVDCGGGTQDRTRSCDDMNHGGYDCSGSLSESQACNTQSCWTAMSASGGAITYSGDYRIHTFNSSGSFNVNVLGTDAVVEYLVIGGGGGGGRYGGAGGGAGQFRTGTGLPMTASSFGITVGAGGTWQGYILSNSAGSPSTFSSITSIGGTQGYPGTMTVGGASGNGFAGGTPSSCFCESGGGGGASAAGGSRHGGAGTSSSISGSSVCYAGGGGGGTNDNGAVGSCGGGNNDTSGTANTGGGGGGGVGFGAGNPGYGGSGVVIIKYKYQ